MSNMLCWPIRLEARIWLSQSQDVGSNPMWAIKLGLLGEYGRPHCPVKAEIMGSNPIQTAKNMRFTFKAV